VGSSQNMPIGQVQAEGKVRLKSDQSILNAAIGAAANVVSGDLILEAAQGMIGSEADPFYTDLLVNATVTARADADVWLFERNGDMNIESVYSQTGIAHLEAEGSILDPFNTDFTKVKADRIELVAGGSIGASGTPDNPNPNYLEIDVIGSGTVQPERPRRCVADW